MQTSYRRMLRGELVRRMNARPGFSLRAFARHLDLQASQLSRVLSGKRNLSPLSAKLIADKVFPDVGTQELFVSLVEHSTCRNPKQREALAQKIVERDVGPNLQLEAFKIISEWYHLAILDLTFVSGFTWSTNNVATYLGISPIQVRDALERLERLGLITKKAGRYAKTIERLSTPDGIPSRSIREHHRQMLSKAVDSIDQQSVKERILRGKTMAIRMRDLPKLQAAIERFMAEVTRINDRAPVKDRLYQVSVQLFDLKARSQR